MAKGLHQGILDGIRRIVFGEGKSTDAVLAKSEDADSRIDLTGELAIGAADDLLVGGVIVPQRVVVSAVLPGTLPATGANYGVFFVADRAYEIVSIREAHSTAGSDGGAVTLAVEKLTGTEALDAGVSTMTGTFNLKGTADTVQEATLTATGADKLLAAGDRLALLDAGVLTAVAGLCVTVELKPV